MLHLREVRVNKRVLPLIKGMTLQVGLGSI